MAQVAFFPGLFGTRLALAQAGLFGPRVIWRNDVEIARGGLLQLELAADGKSPGPDTEGYAVIASTVMDEYYGGLVQAMQMAGHTVAQIGYDWRLSIPQAARAAWASMYAAFPTGPIQVVAHSLGGKVAQAVAAIGAAPSGPTTIARIIYLGTPHYGSFETFRLWFGLPYLYNRLIEVQGYQIDRSLAVNPLYMQKTLASWPSLYELMPAKNSGPLHASDPTTAAQIYQASEYAIANPYITQARLDAAWPVQDALAAQPAGVAGYIITGNGFKTADNLLPVFLPDREDGYHYTLAGDGIVAEPQALIPGVVPGAAFEYTHDILPKVPIVWQWITHELFGL